MRILNQVILSRQVVLAAAFIGFAGSAQAALQFCNETRDVQSIAIGYKGPVDWMSEGWWNIDPGDCATVIGGDLQKQFYYYRAEVNAGDFAGENYMFCTTPDEFEIVGDTNCQARGYDSESFREIDTGDSATDFTFTLVDGESAPRSEDGPVNDTSTAPEGETGLRFCNSTEVIHSVSIGYENDKGFLSEGWWNLDPGECAVAIAGALQKRYYYYRTEVDGGPFEGEGYMFCTSPEVYSIQGDTDCEARGYDTEAFSEIDTGPTATGYTFYITADGSNMPPAGTGDTTATITPPPAAGGAGLEVCNDTSDIQAVAFGYEGAQGWTSEGWWNVDPGACTVPALDGVNRRYFYYRAEVDGGPFTGENYFFCTTPEAFEIVGDSECEARGYAREDFREVDTGSNTGDYTLRLTDAGLADTAPSEDDRGEFPTTTTTPPPSTGAAGLRVCNDTSDIQAVAFGYEGAQGWTSEGWWNVDPGACTVPALDGVNRRYFYYRAEVDGGPFTGENYFFCTTPEAFEIVGDSECAARGYAREDFREVDTGSNTGDYTLRLTDAGLADTAPAVDTAPDTPKDTGDPGDRPGTLTDEEPAADPEEPSFDFGLPGDDTPDVPDTATETPSDIPADTPPDMAPDTDMTPEADDTPDFDLVPEEDDDPRPPRRGGSRG